jgi:hypothetical protein
MTIKISRILHAGYIFESGSTQIAVDPIFENPFSKNCYAFPPVRFDLDSIKNLTLSAVFISHYHDDHCSLESLDLLGRETPIYLFCLHEELFSMIRQLGFKKVHTLELNTPVQVGDFRITPRRALDAEVDSILQIETGGLNILNMVDSWMDEDTLALLHRQNPWDLILWPFQTMRELEVLCPSRAQALSQELPPEWISQLRTLAPRYVVPSSCQFVQESWSWYNHALFPITYAQFEQEVRAAIPSAQVLRMNPSASVMLSKGSVEKTAALPWVIPVGDQNVDYEFQKDLIPPLTAEVAQKLPALAEEQKQKVYDYCQRGLIQRYQEIGPANDIYFNKDRIWKLSLFDASGEARHFFYKLKDDDLELLESSVAETDWITEVPLSKLHGALFFGESLTSMYLRLIGIQFESEIDDPLIRTLFNGVFGAYQKAQLLKLGYS